MRVPSDTLLLVEESGVQALVAVRFNSEGADFEFIVALDEDGDTVVVEDAA